MKKENIIIGLLLLVLAVMVVPMFGSDSALGSSTCNSGNCTDFDAVDVTAGYYVDGVQVINGSGDIVSGSITTTDAVSVGAFTQGGGITSTSTVASSVTLLASAFDTENVIEMQCLFASCTINLPATSTLESFVPTAGNVRTIWIRNSSPTAATSTTVAAGAGMTFKLAASSTPTIVGDTDGDNTLRLDFSRKSDTDINVYITKFQDSL